MRRTLLLGSARTRAALLIVMTVAVLAGTTAVSASTAARKAATGGVVTFGVQPATATQPDTRTYFSFSVTPGARITDHIAVSNYSYQRLTLTIHASDAQNTPTGDFALIPPDQRSDQLGKWISIPPAFQKIVVPARGFRIVPFTVTIPVNAQPGDHAGGILATLESSARSKTGQRYRLLQNVGSRIFARVSGTLHPVLVVEGVRIRYHGTIDPFGRGRAEITFTVHNAGNVALGGKQSVHVSGLFGLGSAAKGLRQLGVLLPGTSVRESVTVRGIFPQIWMTAHVSISPLILPGSVQPLNGPFSARGHFWAIPWTLLGLIVLIVAGALWVTRRRRRGTPPGRGSKAPLPSVGRYLDRPLEENGRRNGRPAEETVQ